MKTSGWNVKSKCDGYVMWGLVEPKSEHVEFFIGVKGIFGGVKGGMSIPRVQGRSWFGFLVPLSLLSAVADGV